MNMMTSPDERDDASGPLPAYGRFAEPTDRRGFLARLSVALGIVAAALVALPGVGFVLGPILRAPPSVWRRVGPVDAFAIGETVEVRFSDARAQAWAGATSLTGAWLRRVAEQDFQAFSLDCSHLGCPVRWESGAKLFMCPCHGGVYYEDGAVAGGPPPRALTRYPVRVREGQVEVLTSPVPIT